MILRAAAIVVGIVGLYLDVWHSNVLPFSHNAVGLGNNHSIHAVVGLVLLILAAWLWVRAGKAAPA